jgi:transposase
MPEYVKRQKNDAADAEAICEAVTRANMRFVETKTPEQHMLMLTSLFSLLISSAGVFLVAPLRRRGAPANRALRPLQRHRQPQARASPAHARQSPAAR